MTTNTDDSLAPAARYLLESVSITRARPSLGKRGGWCVVIQTPEHGRLVERGPMTDGEALEVITSIMYGEDIPYIRQFNRVGEPNE